MKAWATPLAPPSGIWLTAKTCYLPHIQKQTPEKERESSKDRDKREKREGRREREGEGEVGSPRDGGDRGREGEGDREGQSDRRGRQREGERETETEIGKGRDRAPGIESVGEREEKRGDGKREKLERHTT